MRRPCPAFSVALPDQGSGASDAGRQIDGQDSDDNQYQEVNDTNTDPVSPIATGRLEEG